MASTLLILGCITTVLLVGIELNGTCRIRGTTGTFVLYTRKYFRTRTPVLHVKEILKVVSKEEVGGVLSLDLGRKHTRLAHGRPTAVAHGRRVRRQRFSC